MKFEFVDLQTVKVILSPTDMDNFSITYEQIDYDDPATRRVIVYLLKQIRQETSIDLTRGKLFIEAFPFEEGGCVLYINQISKETTAKSHGFHTPLIFRLSSLDSVIQACQSLYFRCLHLVFKSSLYEVQGNYFLFIYSYVKMEKKILTVLGEYGNYTGEGPLLAAKVAEYGHPIVLNQAVETMLCYFPRRN